MREKIQRFGRFLSGMVLPNIGAFIAWGLITALFIATGWAPNKTFASLVDPMIKYLLPLLIGYTGGKLVHGQRGGVVGAAASMGVIVGSTIPMFLGAMIMGPFAGFLMKKFDEAIDGKIPSGFEMLVNNFSAGILAAALAIFALVGVGPVVQALSTALGNSVNVFVKAGLLPLASLFIEPAKILFLNNAINHGVLTPLGVAQVATAGKSVFYLLEANPGPGLGLLAAVWMFGKGAAKESAPGAIIIHFLGGIHEIYFPYVLMNPILLIAVIGGGMSGVLTFTLLGAGLVASPSPGSIFAVMAMAPKGGLLPVLAGVSVAAVVTFLIAAVILRAKESKTDLESAKSQVKELKGLRQTNIKKIVFACDAGMGSSAMGASTLRKKIKAAGLDIEVVHSSIEEIPSDAQLIVTHESLADRAHTDHPGIEIVTITNFVGAPEYDTLVSRLAK